MLVEVALTPQVFDNASNPDTATWLACLNELGHGFFPRNAAFPIVASDLQEGGWMDEVRRAVQRIADQAARWKVQELVQRFKDIVVSRPALNDWPSDQRGWAEEAAASHKSEPIGRIVLTDAFHADYQPTDAAYCALRGVRENAFWSGIQNTDQQVIMSIPAQIALLRPICLHAHYLALKLPHAHGTSDDETPFAAAVFGSCFLRPVGFSAVHAELHIVGDGLVDTALNNVINNVKHILAKSLPRGSQVMLCLWPHFIDRKLVAGVLKTSAGQQLRAPRWAVSFQHVARPHDSSPPTGWWLIPPRDLATISQDADASNPAILHRIQLQF